MNQKHKNWLNQVLIKGKSQSNSKNIILNFLHSEEMSAWMVLQEFLQSQEVKRLSHYQQFKRLIIQNKQEVQTLPMAMYIYELQQQQKKLTSYMGSSVYSSSLRTIWHRHYRQLVQNGQLLMFNLWISQSDQWNTEAAKQSIQMVMRVFCKFKINQNIRIQKQQIQSLVYWLCYFDFNKEEQVEYLMEILKFLRSFIIMKHQSDIEKQQHVLLKFFIQVLSQCGNCRGNIGWIFACYFQNQKVVRQFICFYSDIIVQMPAQKIVNLFTNMFKISMEVPQLLFLLECSRVLESQQKYYELKCIYQRVVLPIIIRKGKKCVKISGLVLEFGSLYIIGFLSHLDIGINGLKCVLCNISEIQQIQYRDKWIQLVFFLVQKNKELYHNFAMENLKKQKINLDDALKISKSKSYDQKRVWEVTLRNSKMFKNYHKQKSVYKGIQNKSSQCYIICAIQALFTTGNLVKILQEFKYCSRTGVCSALKQVFKDLDPKQKSKYYSSITVDNIKRYGPQIFKQSLCQQDSQQYLLQLFQQIQQQLKVKKQALLLQEFKKTFQIQYERTFKCSSCAFSLIQQQNHYIYTIPHNLTLQRQNIEKLQDYKCEKCSAKTITSYGKLIPQSKILIVHINRFSYKYEKSQKQLSTQTIRRQFMNYKLAGIVFHIGRDVQSGHYVYYYKISAKKWIQMNDKNVMEFQIEDQNEQFQLQMRAEYTPYILFYKIQQS